MNRLDNESLTRIHELLEWCSHYANEIDLTCRPEILLANFFKKSESYDFR